MPLPTIDVKDAGGVTRTINTTPAGGQATASNSLPVVLASDVTPTVNIGNVPEVEIKNDAGNPMPVAKVQQSVVDCLIANGASLSSGIDLGVYRLVGITLPAVFEPTLLSFQSSYDGATWSNVYGSDGIEKTAVCAAGRRVIVSPADFYGVRWLRVRGGTAAAAQVVGADRTIKLIAEA